MLTTLSIVSLDQGKIWREPPAQAEPAERPADEAAPVRGWLSLLRPPALPAILRPARG